MAVTAKASDVITNRDASPRVFSDAHLSKGVLLEGVGHIALAATDDAGSTLRFCSVPSNARISQVLLSCDDSGTTGAINIGIYKSTQDGGTVVDADHFASAQLLTTALVNSDVTHESGEFPIEEIELQLWEALGLTSDPAIEYDVVGVVTAAAENAADVTLKVRYVI
jgi:hypothetical protein